MASEITDDLSSVRDHLSSGRNFLLKGGAGSGKTHSLIDVFRLLYENDPHARVACITYTNVAVEEINRRYANKRLAVSTIHSFLWQQLKNYQTELIDSLLSCIERGVIYNPTGVILTTKVLHESGITYGEYLSLKDGQISHNELLKIATVMYESYPRLARITKSKYDYIFIDEYQDTHKEVLNILFNKVQNNSADSPLTIGLFGDDMQQIYDHGIDKVDEAWEVHEVIKEDNYRSCTAIVNQVNNRLRIDEIKQIAVGELKDYDGRVQFYYSSNPEYRVADIANMIGWGEDFHALYLTHKLLAINAGYHNLYAIYDTPSFALSAIKNELKGIAVDIDSEATVRDLIVLLKQNGIDVDRAGIKEDKLIIFLDAKYSQIGHLSKRLITTKEELCPLLDFAIRIAQQNRLYMKGQIYKLVSDLTKDGSVIIATHQLRREVQKVYESLSAVCDSGTIGDVFDFAEKNQKIFTPGDRFTQRKNDCPQLFSAVRGVAFNEVNSVLKTLDDDSRHRTQHSSKGKAFDNVIVVLDNGRWYQGSDYTNVFNAGYPESDIDTMSKKLVYTACSRAIKNLTLFYYIDPNSNWRAQQTHSSVIRDARAMFGLDKVINLDA
jgi:DNA helicase-2/ATP-dependent DNA helicase PcrA